MSKIKYISFFKKDAIFDSERIVGELIDVCEQIDLGEGGIMCRMQAVQGELVRCKDCKYWNDGTCEMLGTVQMNANDFCSRGERIE